MTVGGQLHIGAIYTRKQLRQLFGIADATINNGVFPFSPDSVWLFVTERKTPDRTQYADRLDGDILQWDGQTMGRTDALIIEHETHARELLVFYRHTKDEHPGAGFRYEGQFTYVSHYGSRPTHFILQRASPVAAIVRSDLAAVAAEEDDEELFVEGGQGLRYTRHYERNPRLRAAAVAYHGTNCMGCGFNFERVYGPHGASYIEVHHLYPISTLLKQTSVDPRTDLVVVCANCHRMIHRQRNAVLSLDQLKRLLC